MGKCASVSITVRTCEGHPVDEALPLLPAVPDQRVTVGAHLKSGVISGKQQQRQQIHSEFKTVLLALKTGEGLAWENRRIGTVPWWRQWLGQGP